MATVGYFEEAPGVKSSTRVLAVILVGAAVGFVTVIAVYLLRRPDPSAAVIGTATGIVTALVSSGAVAISKRTRTTSTETLVEGATHDDH